jgi:hypothetical protein
LGQHLADEIDDADHIFRYVGGGAIDGDFIEPAAFRRKIKDGKLEEALSVNWVEWFRMSTPREAVQPLRDVFLKKDFRVGPTSRFALLNVGGAKHAAAKYAAVSIILDEQPDDQSHALVKDYDEALNEQVAEELAKAIIATYPTKPLS